MQTKLYYNPQTHSYRVGVELLIEERRKLARKNIEMAQEYQLGIEVGNTAVMLLKGEEYEY